MIHEVNLSRETKIYLWQITHLQMDLLACATTLFPGFSRQNLQTALEQKMPAQRAERVAKWVFGHQKAIEGLKEFVTGTQSERQNLVAAIRRDIWHLSPARRRETLECYFDADRNLQRYQKGAKQFLVTFYEQLGNGIKTDILAHNPCNVQKYGRKLFFAAYERANPNQYICAICDEHRPITMLRDSYFSDIEHYFPKSIYPHLACHPYNLIPICKACNSAHSDRDPLTPQNGGARRKLGEVFLPYRQDSVRLHGAIKLDWNSSPSPQLAFGGMPANITSMFSAKIQAFSEIYDIPSRWQKRIHSIGEQLWRQMSAFARTEMDKNEALDPFKVKTALERLLDYLIADLGASPWSFILVWYLSYLLVAELETAIQAQKTIAEIPLVKTLEEVIQHATANPSAVLSAESVLETSRKLYGKDK